MTLEEKIRKPVFAYNEIIKRLPHRFPFLLVDKIIELDLGKGEILGLKNVTCNEQFFQGHFPEEPIMPGVLQVEAVAQVGAVFLYEKGFRGIKVLASIKNAKFRKVIRPGDTILLKATVLHLSARGGKMHGEVLLGKEKAAEAEIVFGILPEEKPTVESSKNKGIE